MTDFSWTRCPISPKILCLREAVAEPKPYNFMNDNSHDDDLMNKKNKKRKKVINESGCTRNIDISNPIISLLENNDDDDDDDIIARIPFSSTTTTTRSSLINGDDLVLKILSRLPAKSLMRFKCVCKRWLFLIQQDPHLHDLHLKRSIEARQGLLIFIPLNEQLPRRWSSRFHKFISHRQEHFMSADLFLEGRKAEAAFHTIREVNSLHYDRVLKPVNGLICFISLSAFAVRICNLCTREATPWIISKLLKKEKKEYDGVVKLACLPDYKDRFPNYGFRFPNYGFGFDPATKKHKVICLWELSKSPRLRGKYRKTQHLQGVEKFRAKRERVIICEILTVGQNSSWRRINEVPPYPLREDSIYVNGSIYWTNYNYSDKDRGNFTDDPKVIVAFDVGSEKFRVIPIPNFVSDGAFDLDLGKLSLIEFDVRVALLFPIFNFTVTLWIFDGDFEKKKKKKENETCTGTRNWTKQIIKLPMFDRITSPKFHMVVGTDQIIFEFYKCFRRKVRHVHLYLYNWKTKMYKKVGISGFQFTNFPTYYRKTSLFTTFVESLYSVQVTRQGCHTQLPPGK